MQALLLDRAFGKVAPLEFATTVTESYYSLLQQNALTRVFPPNCHTNAAINSLSLETEDYQYLLSGCADSSIKLWDLNSQSEIDNGSSTIHQDLNKQHSDYDIYDYDHPVQTFTNIATVPRKSAHTFGISAIQWWPYDTGMFVSASFDHTVKIWDTNELTPVHSFDVTNRVYAIDLSGSESPNGFSSSALVAVGSDQPFIRLLDLRSTSSAHTLTGHKGKTLAVKWHPLNPNLLSSGGFDGEVKIWDIRRSKSCLCRLDMLRTNNQADSADNLAKASVKAHSGPVNGLVWNEQGTELYTAGNDDKVRVWDMISSLAPPINKLVNFGPLTRNKYPQTIPIMLNPSYETELQYLLFPSDNSDLFVFRTVDGKMVSRLSRKGTKNSGRTCSMVNAGPFTGKYYCGTIDGEIIAWSPHWEQPNIEDLVEDTNEVDVQDVLSKRKLAEEARRNLEDDPYFNGEP
ncbi:WD repeat protein [Scheffersomyces stipitis CBS 6054]|uniref:WD repeat protein n=1 Tax=Scheffersomyces stipitis (strain ATCC 58785 / CBS 6054 / NBRC 10063 / NRRL Y-11545) TaxID=322104 RepID=A3LUE8_PICST|nr:WD repeat protein [Scheffersomyces stipitis CBS 6054]ABN66226.2 WD repeat protein [Scheffersomyces stipitis CBS 6054]